MMALNLEKNKESLLAAWNEVVDDKISTDWVLVGYDGQTFDLKVVSKGDGGLEEMIEDLNSGKIMYAFCRVNDPKTSLHKLVLINWQGEAAPMDKKGKCANHIRDVTAFFKGAHVTINARTEDDVDPQVVMDKVTKSTVSAYNFKDRSVRDKVSKPVGSVYTKTVPAINAVERDKFWEKEEAEEKVRIEAERKKLEEQRKKLEVEFKEREIDEALAREAKVKERSRSISLLREAERGDGNTVLAEKERWDKQVAEDQKFELERRKRSDSLRQERKHEAQTLISKRTIDARAVFEQNTVAGQLANNRSSSINHRNSLTMNESVFNTEEPVPVSVPVPTSIKETSVPDIGKIERSLPRPDVIPMTPPESRSPDQSETERPTETKVEPDLSNARNLLREGLPRRHDSETDHEENPVWEEPMQQEEPLPNNNVESKPVPQTEDIGLTARALYDYQADDDNEISFDPDDIISHIDQIDEGWWQGLAPNGQYGLFPANYVELIAPSK